MKPGCRRAHLSTNVRMAVYVGDSSAGENSAGESKLEESSILSKPESNSAWLLLRSTRVPNDADNMRSTTLRTMPLSAWKGLLSELTYWDLHFLSYPAVWGVVYDIGVG
jgi:hypothetical protein